MTKRIVWSFFGKGGVDCLCVCGGERYNPEEVHHLGNLQGCVRLGAIIATHAVRKDAKPKLHFYPIASHLTFSYIGIRCSNITLIYF